MSIPNFPAFDSYVCEGEFVSIEFDGFELTATVHLGFTGECPWDREDGHGPVTDWTTRAKAPGERVLCSDRDSRRYYDFGEAVRIALRDGWDAPGSEGLKGRAKAAHAAEHDFKVLKAWCNDEWRYCGIAVTVSRHGVELTGPYDHALWGIEANYPGSDNAYLSEVANELADEALAAAREKLAKLAT